MATMLSRRRFLQRAGLAAAAASFSPRYAQAALKKISANEKIHVASIGVGGMGRSHFDRLLKNDEVRLIAASDPDAQRQQAAKEKAAESGQEVATYTHFPEMLDAHPDIDAVFVATPDHWHALATIACLRAGKDVYCEKPLALTLAEGRAMVEHARRFGRVVQMGTMQRSDQAQFRHACELVHNGRIGTLQKVVCFFGDNPRSEYVPDEEPPAYLDWDFWLGPAPWRRFNKMIHPYNFRYFRDYSGGMLTDWGVHLFDIAQWGAGKDHTSPRRIESESRMYQENLYEYPQVCRVRYDYGDVVFEWQQGTPEVAEIEHGENYGTKFYGTEGEVFVNRGGYAARDNKGNAINEVVGPNDIHLYASASHHGDFFQAMHTRKPPICDVEIGHRATAISHLGNISLRVGRSLEYDPDKEFFPNDPAANKMIAKPMRAPWRL
ncbi:MAG: Gfo/Idh/MocA family oxidoreductase [Candidatus Hydrogenedentes bacterium]|nr:Gfo/Idh/MocA family oxidoreductase [Candidatus Hydrogenedentota bacterium]